jgi:hypothetical protein
LGTDLFKCWSKKTKVSGSAAQTNGLVESGVPLTLRILKLNSVPDPCSGVAPPFAKADMYRVLVGPNPDSMYAKMVQLLEMSPAGSTYGGDKVTTVSSKVNSP